MMLERLKNYIKANTDVGEGIQLGGIDGNTEKYIGVYPGNRRRAARVPGEEWAAPASFMPRCWCMGRNMRSAQAKADAVYALFYARAFDMDGAPCAPWSPAAGPCLWGRTTGVCASS
ncbi:MAG: hypothetical protein ACLRRT_13470 [Ruthenibacterium lactatiformans]